MNKPALVKAAMQTDQGRVRRHNEDFVLAWEPTTAAEEAQHGWLYIVADGVGGADAGEIASEFASRRTVEHFLANENSDWGRRLLEAMQASNTDLRQLVADRDDNSRMATTMVAVVIRERKAFMANVGDSRGYLYRQGELNQITKDQSLVAKLVEEGAISELEALNHPRKNVILYSLGSERNPKIDLFELFLDPGDTMVLCSDGLTRHLSDQEIAEIVSSQEPERAAETLVNFANDRGGEDNISVSIILYRGKTAAGRNTAQAPAQQQPQKDQPTMWLFTLGLSLVMIVLMVIIQQLLAI